VTISFQNEGVASITALTTFGVNAKSNENAIGFFGTGFKYAVAIILRNGGSVVLYQGKKRSAFGLKRIVEQGKDFDVVTLSGRPLGFTTRVGIKWEPWMAFRELHCNATDEGGTSFGYKVPPVEGATTIHVDGWPEFAACFEKIGDFILKSKPIYQSSGVDIHPGPANGIFYRGVLVGKLEKPSAFTYNITGHISLTEDRTVKYSWEPSSMVSRAVLQCLDPAIIEDAVTTGKDSFEGHLGFDGCGVDPVPTFLDTVARLAKSPQSSLLAPQVKELLAKHREEFVADERIQLNDEETDMLEAAFRILEKNGCTRIRDVPLYPVAFLGHGVFGLAKGGKIFLSRKCFAAGFTNVVGTLFEEYAHVEMKQQDCTHDFQNYLVDSLARALIAKENGLGILSNLHADRPALAGGNASGSGTVADSADGRGVYPVLAPPGVVGSQVDVEF